MKDVVMSFKVDENTRDNLKRVAFEKDLPVSKIIRDALKYYFQEVEVNGSTKLDDSHNTERRVK